MKTFPYHSGKITGLLLIVSGIALFIPYILLTFTFDYPGILRQETGLVLTQFYAGGNSLIWTWWAFAVVGLPLLKAYILIGQEMEKELYFVRTATYLGITGLIVQFIGLLRWVFVVPMLAKTYVQGNEMAREASKIAFQTIHQYGGVVMGEHVGQLFTIAWTLMMAYAFGRLRLLPQWLVWWGYLASGVYLLAQAELFATVITGFPVWEPAGLIGSTLWLIWLILTGTRFLSTHPCQTAV
jgi:hypothetical protein